MDLIIVIMIISGMVLIYSAIKGRNPKKVVQEALTRGNR